MNNLNNQNRLRALELAREALNLQIASGADNPQDLADSESLLREMSNELRLRA